MLLDVAGYCWLRRDSLFKTTEGFVCAAQENALRTHYYCASILKEECKLECRMCDEHPETVTPRLNTNQDGTKITHERFFHKVCPLVLQFQKIAKVKFSIEPISCFGTSCFLYGVKIKISSNIIMSYTVGKVFLC